jgi:hypothetical protein
MPGPMPFHLEKGPWICALEEMLNDPNGSIASTFFANSSERDTFRAAIKDFCYLPALNGDPNFATPEARLAHMNDDWFGDVDGQRQGGFDTWLQDRVAELGRPDPLPPLSTPATIAEIKALLAFGNDHGLPEYLATWTKPTPSYPTPRRTWPHTGFWRQYYGDVEEIVRETMLTALRVALGITRPGESPRRHLDLEIFWKCGQPWFEGWVTWNLPATAPELGRVTVIFATPGTGSNVLTEAGTLGRVDPQLAPRITASSVEPPASIGDALRRRGMWLITHELNLLLPPIPSTRPTGLGEWIIPAIGPSYAGVGAVKVFEPAFRDGGLPDPDPSRSQAPATTEGSQT